MARIKIKGKENWALAQKQAKQMGIVLTKRKNSKGEYWQRADTSCVIQTKTIETYDASKKF